MANVRLWAEPWRPVIPDWAIYSLPDGLWLFSLLLCLQVVWQRRREWNQIWLFFVLAAVCHEFFQGVWSGLGTFSWTDVEFYLLAAFAARIWPLRKDQRGEYEDDMGRKSGRDGGDRGRVCADWGGH